MKQKPTYPPLEKAGEHTAMSIEMARIYRNQEKIYAVLTDLATKFDFEHGYIDGEGVRINRLW